MDSHMPQKSTSSSNLSAICELLRGMESENKVLTLLKDYPLSNADLISAKGHAMSVLSAINNSISILSCDQDNSYAPNKSLQPFEEGCGRHSPFTINDDRGRTTSLLGVHSTGPNKARYKHSWTKMVSILIDDGYAWRKYGQKPILNTKHPRSYYKCTHNPHCEALKQVQMIDDQPLLYKITYTNRHTCNKGFANPGYVEAMTSTNNDTSLLINFASESTECHSRITSHKQPFPANWGSVKQEDTNKNQYMPPSDLTSKFQTSEYLNKNEAPTSSEIDSSYCYSDESSLTIQSINEYSHDIGVPSYYIL